MIRLKSIDLKKNKIKTLVVPVCEDCDIFQTKSIHSLATLAKKHKEFQGREKDQIILYDLPGFNIPRIVFLGMGKIKDIDPEKLRRFAGSAVKQSIGLGISEISFAGPSAKKTNLDPGIIIEAILEGACLGNHIFDHYKSEKKDKPIKTIELLVPQGLVKDYKAIPARVETICRGTILARDWVSTPSNDKTPDQFTKTISALAGKENLKVKVLKKRELEDQNFGALLAVASGSKNSPRMIIMEYRPRGAKKSMALVGKGVTFDSGGINLKSAEGLVDMKMDMAGAASVAAAIITMARLKLKINIIAAIPVVENMPSGTASRPGDIVKTYSGKTVEIGNTDAEGRLILADALSFVVKNYKPDTIVDLATLTGACVVALGEKIAGVFSYDDKLADAVFTSGEKTGERCWRMPLPDDYKELIKSDFADIRNLASSRWGGAITAALFLAEFIGKTKWLHIDIAGPALAKKGSPCCGPGGTGFGVRLLCDLMEKI